MVDQPATTPSTPRRVGEQAAAPGRGRVAAPRVNESAVRVAAAGVVTSGVLLMVYGLTLAPDLSWAHGSYDGGELITAAATLGVPHPPGYPVYVVLGKLFSIVPVGSIAFRLNAMSAIAVATAAGLLAALLFLRSQVKSGAAALIAIGGGVSFGLLPLIWNQATVAEVYGLDLAFVAAFLFCLVGLRAPIAAGVFLGLSVVSHPTSLLLVPLALSLTPRDQWHRLAAGSAAGLAPLMLLPILARSGSPVIWGEPDTLEGWWWLVSGSLYRANLRLPLTLLDAFASAQRASIWAAPLLILAGLTLPAVAARLDSRQRALVWPLGLTIALYGAFVLLYQTPDAYVLLAPALLLLVFLLMDALPVPPRLAVLFPILMLVAGLQQQSLRQDGTVRALATSVLTAAPEQAIVLTPGDRTVFTMWYFQHVEGLRNDIILVDQNLFAFDWYRAQIRAGHPDLAGLDSDDVDRFRQVNSVRPICEAGLVSAAASGVPPGYTYRLGFAGQAPFVLCQD